MLKENINDRPFSSQAYDEIWFIEKIIESTKDEVVEKYLKNKAKKMHLRIFDKRNSNFIIWIPSKKEGNSNKTINNKIKNKFNSNYNDVYPQVNQYQNNKDCSQVPNSCLSNNNYGNEVYFCWNSLMINQDISYHNHNNQVMNFNMGMNNNIINNDW